MLATLPPDELFRHLVVLGPTGSGKTRHVILPLLREVLARDAMDPEKRAVYDVEYRTIGKEDGVVRWIAARGRGFFDETGRCQRLLWQVLAVLRSG